MRAHPGAIGFPRGYDGAELETDRGVEPIRFAPLPASPELRKSVLVVDDDRFFLGALTRAMEVAGFRVTAAGGATAALKSIAETDFDLIVSDLRMPRMDGLELRDTIAGDAKRAAIPFIFLTGSREDADVEVAGKLGVQHFLEKTAPISELTTLAVQLAG